MRGSRPETSRFLMRLAAFVTAVVACMAMLSGAIADAAVSSRPSTPAATAGAPGLATTLPAGHATARRSLSRVRIMLIKPQTTITCTLAVQYPHNSTHVPENVNVVATIACTAPVSELGITVGLYFNGALVASGTNTNAGSPAIQGNAATPCVSGTYTGGAVGAVIFPPGYVPPEGSMGEVYSPSIAITC
jgi:hypothetical protein